MHYEGTPGLPATDMTSGGCRFNFTVAGVPFADFYSVELSHRGEVNYSRADLDAAGWHLPLSLA